jgi:hypothetical protein
MQRLIKFTTENIYLDQGVERYIMNGISAGSFLQAALSGDKELAFIKADAWNKNRLDYIMMQLEQLPAMSHGSYELTSNWQRNHNNVRSDYADRVEKQRVLDRLAGFDYSGYIFK